MKFPAVVKLPPAIYHEQATTWSIWSPFTSDSILPPPPQNNLVPTYVDWLQSTAPKLNIHNSPPYALYQLQ